VHRRQEASKASLRRKKHSVADHFTGAMAAPVLLPPLACGFFFSKRSGTSRSRKPPTKPMTSTISQVRVPGLKSASPILSLGTMPEANSSRRTPAEMTPIRSRRVPSVRRFYRLNGSVGCSLHGGRRSGVSAEGSVGCYG